MAIRECRADSAGGEVAAVDGWDDRTARVEPCTMRARRRLPLASDGCGGAGIHGFERHCLPFFSRIIEKRVIVYTTSAHNDPIKLIRREIRSFYALHFSFVEESGGRFVHTELCIIQ